MGSILISTIIDEVRADAQDTDINDWSQARMLLFANSVSRDIAIYKPDASITNETLQLVAGTKQSCPSDSLAFIRLIRNMGADGLTVGNGITLISDEQYFTRMNPAWHTATASATVESYFFDKRNPKTFFVYPPQPSSGMGYVEMENVTLPTSMTAVTDAIPLDDIYADAYRSGMLSYCYRLDKYMRSYPGMWREHFNSFLTILGVKEENETVTEPA